MDALSTLLSDTLVHGYLALWVIVFLGSAGIPLPTDAVVLAAGALAGHGELNPVVVGLVVITAAACGDTVGYFVGWKVGKRATDWLEHSRVGRRIIPPRTLERGQTYFARYGGWAIFLSRWLAGMFSGVVNLLAGVRRFPFPACILNYNRLTVRIGCGRPIPLRSSETGKKHGSPHPHRRRARTVAGAIAEPAWHKDGRSGRDP